MGFNEHIIGIHGVMIDLGKFNHIMAFNFVVGEVLLGDVSSILLNN
jgi:hypothetical protein